MELTIRGAVAALGSMAQTIRWGVRDRYRHGMAMANRFRLRGVTFVGITGTAGKTTTKELAAAVLASAGPCHSTVASRNDHELVDWTVRSATRRHRFCVVEASATEPGYLDRSIRAIRPDIAVLTVIGREHFRAYGSEEAIALEKRKLVDALPRHGVAVLNIDDPYVRSIGAGRAGHTIWVGKGEGATLRLLEASSKPPEPLTLKLAYQGREVQVRTRLHGAHLALPCLCAIGVGLAAGIDLDAAVAVLAEVEPAEGRMQLVEDGEGVSFVRDDFKAPEWSLDAPLEFMRAANAPRKVVVLGTVSDSNVEDRRRYSRAARQALAVADLVVLVGNQTLSESRARAIRDDGTLQVFRSLRDASRWLHETLRRGDLVLLKGTNKQDHLVRLYLDRRAPVQCWDMTCGRHEFCASECSKVFRAPVAKGHGGEADVAILEATNFDDGNRSNRAVALPILVGLGNPGNEYVGTPHNIGYRILEELARSRGAVWREEPEGAVASIALEGVELRLFKPNVFVNLSGQSLESFLARAGGRLEDCLIVLDDADLKLGDARLKREGGDAGHKGMRSIMNALGTDAIARIRVGIRGEHDARTASRLVLDRLSTDDDAMLADGINRAEVLIRRFVLEFASRQREAP